MARYNTTAPTGSQSSAGSIAAPSSGPQTLSGTGPYTTNLPDPRLYPGVQQIYFNSATAVITLSTPSGVFTGAGSSGTSTQAFPVGTTITLESDGTNYIIISEDGGPLIATTISASSTVALSPANANVTISPTGTGTVAIAPAAVGTIDNMTIGGTTKAGGNFTTLSSNSTTTLGATSASSIDNTPIGSTTPSTVAASSLTLSGSTILQQVTEKVQTIVTPGTSTSQAWTSGSIFYVTGMSSAFTLNVTGVPTTANRTVIITLILVQGATAYNCNALQINGSGQTIKSPGGVFPTSVANRTEIQTFTCINTAGTGTFTVLTQLSSYA